MVHRADSTNTLTVAKSETADTCYHPLFSSLDADTVLVTRDGVHFRVHSLTLKQTSGWFRSMFSLPQKGRHDTPVVIYVDEDRSVLEALLRCVCGFEIPSLNSYEAVEPILYAAEKYEMPGPPSIVRALLNTPVFLDDPLRLFVVACRNGWESEVKYASSLTLALNLHAPEHRQTLQRIDSIPLLNLFDLHRRRREGLRKRINEPPFVSDDGDPRCAHCAQRVSYHTWRELKYVMILEMDERPLGDTMFRGLTSWREAQACWAATCLSCERHLYAKNETVRLIEECIDQLPTTVDFPCFYGVKEETTPSTPRLDSPS